MKLLCFFGVFALTSPNRSILKRVFYATPTPFWRYEECFLCNTNTILEVWRVFFLLFVVFLGLHLPCWVILYMLWCFECTYLFITISWDDVKTLLVNFSGMIQDNDLWYGDINGTLYSSSVLWSRLLWLNALNLMWFSSILLSVCLICNTCTHQGCSRSYRV
jgi:hypothetical protein